MKKLFFILFFYLLFSETQAQTGIGGTRVMFPCDTCSGNHNPLVYLGGNIISADMVDSPDGKYLKLLTGSIIDTNAVPAYFDIYSLFWNEPASCVSFRISNISIDFTWSSVGQYEVRALASIPGAGCRLWLASALGFPGPGESTFQTDPLDPISRFILEEKVNNSYSIIFGMNSDTPIWKDWAGKSKVNMFGFTGLEPNAEYRLYEVNIGQYIPMRLASYDCRLPGAVKDETLKEKIKIYPSPAVEFINIDIADMHESYHIQLISDSGKILFDKNCDGNSTVPLLNLSKGLYLVKINVGDHYFTKKVIKE